MSIGIDFVNIKDFQRRLSARGALEKIFTTAELEQNTKTESLAGVFALKEAFCKALGRKVDWHDVWIEKSKSGKPLLQSSLLQERTAEVSISHDGEYAIAIVLIH